MGRRNTSAAVIAAPSAAPAAPTHCGLTVETWPISRILPYESNARNIPKKAIEKVALSLREFGWRQPIVVDTAGVIVVGHVRRLAAIQNGWTEAPVHVATDLTAAQIKAYRLMDNRAHDEATWNREVLGTEVLDLKGLGSFDLLSTGFDPRELDKLGAAATAVAATATRGEGLEFRVVVDCKDERHQNEMLERFRAEGLKCRALIS